MSLQYCKDGVADKSRLRTCYTSGMLQLRLYTRNIACPQNSGTDYSDNDRQRLSRNFSSGWKRAL